MNNEYRKDEYIKSNINDRSGECQGESMQARTPSEDEVLEDIFSAEEFQSLEGPSFTFCDEDLEERVHEDSKKRPPKRFSILKFAAILLALVVLGTSAGFGYRYAGTFFAEKRIELKTSEVSNAENVSINEKNLSNIVSSIAEKYKPAVVSIIIGVSTYNGIDDQVVGTGVVFSEDEENIYIVTNDHVVSSAQGNGMYNRKLPVKVAFEKDKGSFEAEILGSDTFSDLAVLSVKKEGISEEFLDTLVPVTFADSDEVKVGEWAIAIGNPLGYIDTTTLGIVSGIDRKIGTSSRNALGSAVSLIQIDAAINSGNSGGATFNLNGELIGINTIKIKETGVEGLGFAIASNDVRTIVTQILENGEVERAFLGIEGNTVGLTPGNEFGMDTGVQILGIVEDSAAEKFGLMVDDVIIAIDSQETPAWDYLADIIKSKTVGDKVEVTLIRNGSDKVVIEVELGARPKMK